MKSKISANYQMFILLLLTVSLFFLWIIKDLYIPISGAMILSIVFYPTYKKLLVITRSRKRLASLLTVLTIIVVVAIPTFVAGSFVFKQAQIFYEEFVSAKTIEEIELDLINTAYSLKERFNLSGFNEEYYTTKLSEGVKLAIKWISDQTFSVGQNTVSFVLYIFLMIYLTFVINKNSKSLKQTIISLSPIDSNIMKLLISRIVSITRAVVKGTLFVGVIQGTIGGLLFWISGINTAAIWGFLMILLSVIPLIGPGIIWLPAGVILILAGNIFGGLVILLGGFLIISTVDNILRPLLIGRDSQLPDSVILISTLGGISSLGIIGFVIGPVIAGVLFSMWQIFGENYASFSKNVD